MSIEQAKAVIRDHEALTASGDVDGILRNMDLDVAFLAPDAPLIEGQEAIRRFYDSLFSIGSWEFGHEYSSAIKVGDLVLLHGVARGTMTPHGQEVTALSNNFMITMRRNSDGQYRIWRAAFAPGGE